MITRKKAKRPMATNMKFNAEYALKPIVTSNRGEVVDGLFANLFNSSPAGIFIVLDKRFQLVNPSFQEKTGYSADELVGTDPMNIVHPEDRSMVRENAVKVLKGEHSDGYEYRIITKTGENRWVLERVASVRYQGERAVLGNFTDITERKLAEQALQGSEEKYKALFEHLRDAVFLADTETGCLLDTNKQGEVLLGRPRDEIIGMHQSELHPPEKVEEYRQRFADHIHKGHAADYEGEVIRKDGSIATVTVSAAPLTIGGKQLVLELFHDSTKRKLAEEELRLRAQILDSANDSICLHDLDGNLIYVNEAVCRTHGYSREELLKMKIHQLVAPERAGRVGPRFEEMVEKGHVIFESLHTRKDGSIFPVEIHGRTIESDGRKLLLIVIRDITERKQALRVLRENEEKLDAMLHSISAHMSMMDKDLNIIWANEAALKTFGDDIIGKKCYEMYHQRKEPCELELCSILRVFQDENVHQQDTQMIGKDGKIRYLHSSANVALRDEEGKAAAVLEVIWDVTERKQAEDALRESEEKFRLLSENSVMGIFIIQGSKMVYVNPSFAKTFCYRPEEIINTMSPSEFIHADDKDMMMQRLSDRYEGKVTDSDISFKALKRDGSVIHIEATAVLCEYKGKPAVMGTFVDTTERKQAEQALIEAEEKYRTIFQSANDVLVLIDKKGKILDINQKLEEITGYGREELLGKNIKSLAGKLTKKSLAVLVKNFMKRMVGIHVPPYEVEVIASSGRLITAEINAVAICKEGKIVGDLAILRDITERKQADAKLNEVLEDLKRSNAELEQFAYVASHDLQEPLRMVASYTQLLARRYQGKLDNTAEEFINYAVDGANRMRVLITDLLNYSRVTTRGKPLELTDAEAALKEAIANLRIAIEESGASITHDPLPTVLADSTQLVQLFQNLGANAIKFRSKIAPQIHIKAERSNGEWLFSVRDNGIGIDPQFADRIFLVFQRLHTKEEYAGTGIGLALCKKIVERHGGRIWVESQPGKGSTFYFTIPSKGGKSA